MISLNGITLPEDLYLNEFSDMSFSQTTKFTVGGKPIIYTRNNMNGQEISITGNEDSGWIKYNILINLKNDVKINYNNILQLIFNNKNYNVVYAMPTPLEFEPLIEKPYYNDDDYFYGSINLIRV